MRRYQDLIEAILDTGVKKHPVRVDSHVKSEDNKAAKIDRETIGLPCLDFRHDMRMGFPLLTTKKVSFKNVAVELEGFIKGITSKQWFKDRGCNIWNDWCPPSMIPEAIQLQGRDAVKAYMLEQDELGPIYGAQWRDFSGFGHDQFATIAHRLRNNPYDRRMVCSAWVPNLITEMALPPCHYAWNVIVYGDTISLEWQQRSCDLMLGVPYNIASYALLLCLLAHHSGLTPWILKGNLADCHIYEDQIEGAREQLSREPKELPHLLLPRSNGEGPGFSVFDWDHTQVQVTGYHPHPPLKFAKALVT
jgi:thymidylate synthase